MRVLLHTAADSPARIGIAVVCAFAAMLAAAVAVRPEMMAAAMGMARGLVVGFGL